MTTPPHCSRVDAPLPVNGGRQRRQAGSILWRAIRKKLNVAWIPNMVSDRARVRWYRRIGYAIGEQVFIGMGCYLDDYAPELIRIEDRVTISYRVTFAAHGVTESKPIVIRHGVYVGCACTILQGVEIGECALVGGGSVVNRSIPPGVIAVGVPCRPIKDRCTSEAHLREFLAHMQLPAARHDEVIRKRREMCAAWRGESGFVPAF